MRLNDLPGLIQPPLRREFPWLVLQVCLLVVLLHANAPEVWFWFAALLVLLLWRSLTWRARRQQALNQGTSESGSERGSETGASG